MLQCCNVAMLQQVAPGMPKQGKGERNGGTRVNPPSPLKGFRAVTSFSE
jgi:hypothetical protein